MKAILPFVVAALVVVACLVGAFWQSDQALQALFALDSTKVIGSVIALTAIGLLTMALIQAARGLFPLRARYHENEVQVWLADGVSLLHQRLGIQKKSADSDLFYDLPIQNICGQIAAIADGVLVECTNPNIKEKKEEDSLRLLKSLAGPGLSGDDLQTLEKPSSAEDVNRIRARLGSHIQRRIDNLQITAGTRWRRRLRITAFILSFLLSASLLASRALGWGQFFALLGAAVLAGLIAGYLASVFRDVVAVIEGLRRQ